MKMDSTDVFLARLRDQASTHADNAEPPMKLHQPVPIRATQQRPEPIATKVSITPKPPTFSDIQHVHDALGLQNMEGRTEASLIDDFINGEYKTKTKRGETGPIGRDAAGSLRRDIDRRVTKMQTDSKLVGLNTHVLK